MRWVVDLRWWLIRKLVGSRVVVLNATIAGELRGRSDQEALICNCTFIGPAQAPVTFRMRLRWLWYKVVNFFRKPKRTYYVGPGGSDANDGMTWVTRKLSLNDVPVGTGDTVYCG